MLQDVLQTIESRRHQSVSALKEFLSIPSVSTDPRQKAGDAALRAVACRPAYVRGFRCEGDGYRRGGSGAFGPRSSGHPVVVAKNKHVAGRPTVLFYGHYDVQPPEPLELWTTPPFQPTVRDGAIYARGAVDDKGQVWAHIEALLAWQAHGGPPVNLTLLIEGEEEIGSIHLADFIRKHREALRADIAVVSDTNQFARGIPALTYGLRGLAYMEVTLTPTDHDLHSGLYGGAVQNPANALCELLATLHDKDGRVNIPGFYDKVLPLSEAERETWKKLPFDEGEFARDIKAPALAGEAGYSTLERIWARPTCDINGLTAGYQGHGAKTVIGSTASAKVSMRLVPDQDPIAIRDAFIAAMRARCPAGVSIEVSCHSYAPAVLVPLHSPAMELASEAVEIGFGVRPTFMRGGGSIPVVSTIKSELGIDTLLVGFGLPDDRVHSPNEKFDLDALHSGAKTAAALYERLGRLLGVH